MALFAYCACDYPFGNLEMFHKERAKTYKAFFDWELSDFGHPLADPGVLRQSHGNQARQDKVWREILAQAGRKAGIPTQERVFRRRVYALTARLKASAAVPYRFCSVQFAVILSAIADRARNGNASVPREASDS